MLNFRQRKSTSWFSISLPISLALLICSQAGANSVQKCFVCNAESSPKCAGPLTPSDTELIKACTNEDSKEAPVGCQIFALKSGPCVSPRVKHFWRECLFPSDMKNYGASYLNVTETTWTSSKSIHYSENLEHATALLNAMNKDRGSNGNPLIQTSKLEDPNSATGWAFYYHPLAEPSYWNLSNGAAILGLFHSTLYEHLEQEKWEIPKGGCPNATSSSTPSSKT